MLLPLSDSARREEPLGDITRHWKEGIVSKMTAAEAGAGKHTPNDWHLRTAKPSNTKKQLAPPRTCMILFASNRCSNIHTHTPERGWPNRGRRPSDGSRVLRAGGDRMGGSSN